MKISRKCFVQVGTDKSVGAGNQDGFGRHRVKDYKKSKTAHETIYPTKS
jgi:hypothetical protein